MPRITEFETGWGDIDGEQPTISIIESRYGENLDWLKMLLQSPADRERENRE